MSRSDNEDARLRVQSRVRNSQNWPPDMLPAKNIVGLGEPPLLDAYAIGVVASRECPAAVFIDVLDRVPTWLEAGRVIISGFHSPLEQQVLRSVLRRDGRVIKVLARGMVGYRPPPDEGGAIEEGRMLVLTACPPSITRTTRATALARNRLVIALADEVFVPHLSDHSPLRGILAQMGKREIMAGPAGTIVETSARSGEDW